MNEINPIKETIRLYAKNIRTSSFINYENVIRQLEPGESYEHFLRNLMKIEVSQRQENQQKRKLNAAKFPFVKTLDEFDFNCLEKVSSGCIWELSNCDFIRNRQNIVMIGNPGAGKTHCLLA
ncbi:ATP-binding protein [Bacillota bacterium LX-D]|nr:ATP-binding protein [Bacillota bacterium LX-D]